MRHRILGISALSLDVYGTLLDLDAVCAEVAARIVPADQSSGPDLGSRLWGEVSKDIFSQFRTMETAGSEDRAGFRSVRRLSHDAYERVLPRLGLTGISPAAAADVLVQAHTTARPFPDALDFLKTVEPGLRTCASSDADREFLDRALEASGLDRYLPRRVCSEAVGAYKAHPSGRFFRAVLDLLGCRPREVAHVGDGESDVVGAKRAGLVAVWLRRSGRPWRRPDIAPDLTVGSLVELASALEGAGTRLRPLRLRPSTRAPSAGRAG